MCTNHSGQVGRPVIEVEGVPWGVLQLCTVPSPERARKESRGLGIVIFDPQPKGLFGRLFAGSVNRSGARSETLTSRIMTDGDKDGDQESVFS
jgi:hypothetical protein